MKALRGVCEPPGGWGLDGGFELVVIHLTSPHRARPSALSGFRSML